jgi:3-hydroxybutyryl-CoA dehydrogenase
MIEGIERVGVVGLGVMGFDISFLYAMRGYETLVHDASPAAMEALIGRSEQTIERLKKRNRISGPEIENIRHCLIPARTLQTLAKMDLVTEAVSETAKTKLAVYQALREAGFSGILTTNTSSLTRAALLASGVCDSGKFASTHFFNPVLYTKMVEFVRGDMDRERLNTIVSFLKSLGREPIETQDISGFVSNSILMYYAVMALRLLEHGGRIDEIDQAAKELRLLPPFISFDSWKPSIVEDVTRVMFELRGDPFLRSSKLLSVLACNNPKFYLEQRPNPEIYQQVGKHPPKLSEPIIQRALTTTIHVAAARVVELGESPATVDFIATEGIKIPRAPLTEIDNIGPGAVLQEIERVSQEGSVSLLSAPQLLAAMADEGQTFYKNGEPSPWLRSVTGPPTTHARH